VVERCRVLTCAGGFVMHRFLSAILFIPVAMMSSPLHAKDCGGLNQAECPLWIQFPSCDASLMALGGRCVNCGAPNEPECPVTVQFPSCDSTLMAQGGRCVSCGAAGQAPCPVTVQVHPCDQANLAPDAATGACQACGGLGDVPCLLVSGRAACDTGYVENFLKGRCMPNEAEYTRPSDQQVIAAYKSAREKYGYAEDLLAGLSGPLAAMEAGPPGRPTPERAEVWRQIEAMLDNDDYDFRTSTMVSQFDVAVLVGYAHGWGVALGPTSTAPAVGAATGVLWEPEPGQDYECREYHTNTGSIGLSVGLNAGIEVGLWRGTLETLTGWGSSVTVGAAAIVGAAYTWSFEPDETGTLQFAGISFKRTGGAGVDAAIAHGHAFTGEKADCFTSY
jgi:hypothetical protein